MKKTITKITILAITGAMLLSAMSGCSSKSKDKDTAQTPANDAVQTSEIAYPLKTNKTIRYLSNNTTKESIETNNTTYPSLKDYEFMKEFEKRTGVKIELWSFTSSETQKVQLMFASGDLPDIIEYDWLNTYPGGPDAALTNGVIKELNPLIDKYAPNFKKGLSARPEISKQIKTDSGKYYAFPFIRDESGVTYIGSVVRKDWLDELSIAPPTTIDEWYNMLKAFKEKKGVPAPFTIEANYLNTGGVLSSPFGVMDGFYIENDKVVYGNILPGYKDYISMLRKWYTEGLLDKDFATVDKNIAATKMTKGTSGATVTLAGSRMGAWLTTMKDDTKYDLIGIPTPTMKKGETPKFGQRENQYPGSFSAAITTACKDDETAVRLLDYIYTKEGSMWVNYGPEGFAYELKDGKVAFKDILTKNPDKSTAFGATASIIGRWTNFPNFQMPTPVQYDYKQQVQAYNEWIKNDAKKYIMPPLTHTSDESTQIAKIKSQVDTLVKEYQLKVILGDKSIDSFDAYVSDVKKAGIDKMIELKQKAYDRYKTR